METTREELLQDGDGELDSTTKETPKEPTKKEQQLQLKKARIDAAYQRAREIFREQDLDSESEEELPDEHHHHRITSLLKKKRESLTSG